MTELWYCLNTHPTKELVAVRNAVHQGFVTYLPQYRPKWAGLKERRPLFPGYVFVKFDAALDNWQVLCSTDGVKHLLQTSMGCPAVMPADLIDNIRAQLENEHACFNVQAKPPAAGLGPQAIRAGQRVKIEAGHYFLGGTEGICSWSTSRRIQLLMDLAGERITVTLRRDQVEPIDA
jgi:transcriptional antiterminator RfaH